MHASMHVSLRSMFPSLLFLIEGEVFVLLALQLSVTASVINKVGMTKVQLHTLDYPSMFLSWS